VKSFPKGTARVEHGMIACILMPAHLSESSVQSCLGLIIHVVECSDTEIRQWICSEWHWLFTTDRGPVRITYNVVLLGTSKYLGKVPRGSSGFSRN
jgi:hypothetical protein